MLTFLPLPHIAAVEADMGSPDYLPNSAQRLLAGEVTRFVHGEEGLQAAVQATEVTSTTPVFIGFISSQYWQGSHAFGRCSSVVGTKHLRAVDCRSTGLWFKPARLLSRFFFGLLTFR